MRLKENIQTTRVKSITLRLRKVQLLKGFQTWKYFSNQSVVDDIRNESIEKESRIKAYHIDEIARLNEKHKLALSNFKNDHVNKSEQIEKDHLILLESLKMEHNLAFANLENDHMLKIDILTKNRDKLVTVANDARLGMESKFQTTMDKLRRKYY